MENDGKKGSYAELAAKRIKEYQTLASVIAESADEIRNQLNSGVPLDVVVDDLRRFYDIEITNDRSVSDALYKHRKKEKKAGEKASLQPARQVQSDSSDTVKPSDTVEPRGRKKAKNSTKPKASKKIAKSDDGEVSDKILKIEELLGERLPDSVRPFVEIKNGGLITHFERGTIHSAEIREFTTRIRRLCDRNLI